MPSRVRLLVHGLRAAGRRSASGSPSPRARSTSHRRRHVPPQPERARDRGAGRAEDHGRDLGEPRLPVRSGASSSGATAKMFGNEFRARDRNGRLEGDYLAARPREGGGGSRRADVARRLARTDCAARSRRRAARRGRSRSSSRPSRTGTCPARRCGGTSRRPRCRRSPRRGGRGASTSVSEPSSSASITERVRGGEAVVGTFLNLGSPLAAEICARAGFDWVLVDLEHGAGTEADLIPTLQAVAPTPALVRVESSERARVQRAIDAGADGVMVPRLESAEEARAAVAAPPLRAARRPRRRLHEPRRRLARAGPRARPLVRDPDRDAWARSRRRGRSRRSTASTSSSSALTTSGSRSEPTTSRSTRSSRPPRRPARRRESSPVRAQMQTKRSSAASASCRSPRTRSSSPRPRAGR